VTVVLAAELAVATGRHAHPVVRIPELVDVDPGVALVVAIVPARVAAAGVEAAGGRRFGSAVTFIAFAG
jgi:hypothetical protein